MLSTNLEVSWFFCSLCLFKGLILYIWCRQACISRNRRWTPSARMYSLTHGAGVASRIVNRVQCVLLGPHGPVTAPSFGFKTGDRVMPQKADLRQPATEATTRKMGGSTATMLSSAGHVSQSDLCTHRQSTSWRSQDHIGRLTTSSWAPHGEALVLLSFRLSTTTFATSVGPTGLSLSPSLGRSTRPSDSSNTLARPVRQARSFVPVSRSSSLFLNPPRCCRDGFPASLVSMVSSPLYVILFPGL